MGNLNISDEERLARSERMKRLHAEGRAGAEFGKLGGRPKVKRATEVAAEEIEKKGKELFQALWEKVESDSEKISLDAVKFAYELEERERKVHVEEEVRYEHLKQAELAELVIANLVQLVGTGSIDIGEIIDAEVHEIGPTGSTGEGN